jgi:hypothetical protein
MDELALDTDEASQCGGFLLHLLHLDVRAVLILVVGVVPLPVLPHVIEKGVKAWSLLLVFDVNQPDAHAQINREAIEDGEDASIAILQLGAGQLLPRVQVVEEPDDLFRAASRILGPREEKTTEVEDILVGSRECRPGGACCVYNTERERETITTRDRFLLRMSTVQRSSQMHARVRVIRRSAMPAYTSSSC